MINNIFQPFHTMQEINLDWILTKVKNILRFVPDDGAVGQILRRTAHGAEWSNEQGGGGAVDSVNGQTGTVVLTASDVGALPDTYVAPVTSVNGQTGDVIVSGGAVDSVNGQTGTVVLGKSDIGLGNVDNVQQYSATNPPPYPVTSVNSQTGAVTISIPDSTSDLVNDSGFITAAGAPVQSVNGQTGTVTIGNYSSTEVNTHEKWIDNKDIYRKVIRSAFASGTTEIALGISNFGSVVKLSAIGIDGNGVMFAIPYIYNASTFVTMIVLPDSLLPDNTLRIISSNVAAADAYFVIEYTKTT